MSAGWDRAAPKVPDTASCGARMQRREAAFSDDGGERERKRAKAKTKEAGYGRIKSCAVVPQTFRIMLFFFQGMHPESCRIFNSNLAAHHFPI